MSYIFFKTENSASKSWADVAEGLNSYYAGPPNEFGKGIYYLGGITDHEQKISSFSKTNNKIGLYKVPGKTLAISISELIPNQTVGIKHIDFDLIKSTLNSGVPVVYFGYIFSEEKHTQMQVVERTTYFGRNTLNNKLTNFESDTEYDSNIASAIWMAFYKIKNCDIYYCILNDNLLDSTIIKQAEGDVVSFKDTEDKYILLNSHDGNFKSSVFVPLVDSRAAFVGPNIIAANTFRFELDVLGKSKLHIFNKAVIKDEDLPELDLVVECSCKTTINKNRILVDLENKQTATLSYRWVTGTELDYLDYSNETLRYDFIIVRV